MVWWNWCHVFFIVISCNYIGERLEIDSHTTARTLITPWQKYRMCTYARLWVWQRKSPCYGFLLFSGACSFSIFHYIIFLFHKREKISIFHSLQLGKVWFQEDEKLRVHDSSHSSSSVQFLLFVSIIFLYFFRFRFAATASMFNNTIGFPKLKGKVSSQKGWTHHTVTVRKTVQGNLNFQKFYRICCRWHMNPSKSFIK